MIRGPPTVEPSMFLRSRVEHLTCSSNEILSDQDQGTVRDLLAEVKSDVDSLDAEIARLETVLGDLKKRRALGVQRMTGLRVGIAPHKNVPPEILADIFVRCAEGVEVPIPRPELSIAWNLCQVCTRWRSIARAEPLLWAKIDVNSLDDENQSIHIFDLLHDILSNCGGQGKVHLEIYPSTRRDWMRLFELFELYPTRLWKISLYLDTTCPEPIFLPIQAFDSVESVSLSFAEDLEAFCAPISAFSASRNICHAALDFDDDPQLTDRQEMIFPWAQLIDLTLTNISSNSALLILSHCSLLTNLTAQVRGDPDYATHVTESMISLAYLRSMSLSNDDDDGALDDLLSRLVLPSLKEFRVDGYEGEGLPFDLPVFIGFIERSTCTIISLEILDFSPKAEHVLLIMKALPTLTELVIQMATIPEATLAVIQMERFAPSLRKFHGGQFVSVHSAIEFLNGHSTPSGGLVDFEFWLSTEDYSPQDREYFKVLSPDLEKDGRRVTLKLYNPYQRSGGWA